jgi:hypothetical protein
MVRLLDGGECRRGSSFWPFISSLQNGLQALAGFPSALGILAKLDTGMAQSVHPLARGLIRLSGLFALG